MNILNPEILSFVAQQLEARPEDITDISTLRQGMTNRSYVFTCKGKKYILRLPGEGTNLLINRRNEAEVYKIISGLGLCDDPVYINPDNGIKITRFLEGVRVCDPHNLSDITACMAKLREFHAMKLRADHEFDIFGQIDFYESLWNGKPSSHEDYHEIKARVMSLKACIDHDAGNLCLTHIDAVPDNFLFYTKDDGTQGLQLTDWEYSGLQDPHADIAMFCIYSMYSREETDRLIDIYFNGECGRNTRAKIYAYISACGLLWSNWCEYKSSLGVTFGEYATKQYDFARDYSLLALQEAGEVHKVKRAVILAAGKGKRLRPITLTTPKPLIKVNGTRIIDTVIRGLKANGINEIYIVTGYMHEKFSCLENEYPGVKLIYNKDYDTCNNISSLYAAREHLQSSIIIDGDQIISSPEVLRPEFMRSGYNAVWSEDDSPEWMLGVRDGVIASCSRTGGRHGWQLFGISRWTDDDGDKLKHYVEHEFIDRHNTGIYWDDIAMSVYPEDFELGIMSMEKDDVKEIDTLEDLAALERTKHIDLTTTMIPFAAVFGLCMMFALYPEKSSGVLEAVRNFIGDKFGTFYLVTGLGVFLVSLWLAFSDIGKIVLGGQDEKPKYTFWKWGAMIFTCGLAADILFYSFCEWIYYALDSHVKSLGTVQDWASTFPLFHWGFIPWSFYAVLASCFGFMLHVKGVNRQKYSEACRSILGNMTDGLPGKLIDIPAVFALIAGTATTFSVASPLLASSISSITYWWMVQL